MVYLAENQFYIAYRFPPNLSQSTVLVVLVPLKLGAKKINAKSTA